VCWNDVTNFWALLKYEDIRYVSSNPALFSSTKGITIPDPAMPSPVQEGNLIFSDPPRHRQLRKLINSGFTRRRVAVLEPKIREIVRGILDGIEPGSVHEFAEEIAIAQELRAMVQRELARVVGDDAAGVDDDGLDLGPLPVGAPPADVVADGIFLGDVGLAPAVGAAVPGNRRHLRRQRQGQARAKEFASRPSAVHAPQYSDGRAGRSRAAHSGRGTLVLCVSFGNLMRSPSW